MASIKTGLSVAIHHAKTCLNHSPVKHSWIACQSSTPFAPSSAAVLTITRGAHTHQITKHMQYITEDDVKIIADPATMRLDKVRRKPLCIMMNWLLARQKHVLKYATLYLEQGFDVLAVNSTLWQLMRPKGGAQPLAGSLLKFLSTNDHLSPTVVHGFSIGGYIWGELLVKVDNEPELFQPVLERVAAQVWDSVTDVTEISVGVPQAVFPKNKFLRNILKTYIELHLYVFRKPATVHYERASRLYHERPSRAPALFLFSKTDPVGAERNIRECHQMWLDMGMKSTLKCWDKSPHVQHYMHHRHEYLVALYGHLDSCGLVSRPDIMKKRLES